MKVIQRTFPVTEQEYRLLEKMFGQLAEYQAWELIKKNSRNNHTDSQEDVAQEMRMALLRAASYYKRQTYIEKCLELCNEHAKDDFIKKIIEGLNDLWNNRRRHGASKQKFGVYQEKMLDKLTRCLVPQRVRPSKNKPLQIDDKFETYAKQVTWNSLKSLGKKITREKAIRCGQVSLSEYDYLCEF